MDLKEGLITIGGSAFWGAALGEKSNSTGTFVIPGSVQSIGQRAFYESTYLRKFIFASGEADVLSVGIATFGSCPELTTVIFPERLTKLGAGNISGIVQDNKKLQTLYIPAGVTEIANGAISNGQDGEKWCL